MEASTKPRRAEEGRQNLAMTRKMHLCNRTWIPSPYNQRPRQRKNWGALVPPVFGRAINPISSRGADYTHRSTMSPPDFQTSRRACSLSACVKDLDLRVQSILYLEESSGHQNLWVSKGDVPKIYGFVHPC